jgi:hypothetical protein
LVFALAVLSLDWNPGDLHFKLTHARTLTCCLKWQGAVGVIDVATLSVRRWALREQLSKHKLKALADRGYFNGSEIKACDEAGITPLVPKPMASNAKAEGRFSKADFIYIARDDEYRCPAGQPLRRHHTSVENGLRIQTYWTLAAITCRGTAHGRSSASRWRRNLLDAIAFSHGLGQ